MEVSEREQSVSGLGWYLSNLILQFVLVELNAVLQEGEREEEGRNNIRGYIVWTEVFLNVSSNLSE